MAKVHTFKIDNKFGVPDRTIMEFITECEKELGIVNVSMCSSVSQTAALITVVVTKLDDAHESVTGPDPRD